MASKKSKKPVRDPNVPVLAWCCGNTMNAVLIAGEKDIIRCLYTAKEGRNWSPCSIIHREWSAGFKETEMNLFDAGFWAWVGRLMCPVSSAVLKTLPAANTPEAVQRAESMEYLASNNLEMIQITPTDYDLFHHAWNPKAVYDRVPKQFKALAYKIMQHVQKEYVRMGVVTGAENITPWVPDEPPEASGAVAGAPGDAKDDSESALD